MDLLNSAIEGFFEAFVYWSVSLLALIWSYCWNGQLDFSPLCVFKCLLALVAFLLLCVTPGPDMELLSKRPVGHTSRHWKAKAVAARANYLWKAEPLQTGTGPEGTSSPGRVGSHPGKKSSGPVTRDISELKVRGCLGAEVLVAVGPWGDCCMRQSSD